MLLTWKPKKTAPVFLEPAPRGLGSRFVAFVWETLDDLERVYLFLSNILLCLFIQLKVDMLVAARVNISFVVVLSHK